MSTSRTSNIGLLFDLHAEARHQTVMLLDRPFDIAPEGGIRHDAASLAETVRRAAAWLYAAGARRGDRIAIVKRNHYDTLMLAAGAARIGVLPAQLAPLKNVASIRAMIDNLKPQLIVAGAEELDRAYRAGINLADPGVRVVVIGRPEEPLPPNSVSLDDLRGAAEAPVDLVPDEEPMIITHSSGTTGVPKLVVNSGRTILGLASRLERIRFPVVASRRTDIVGSSVTFAHARNVSWTAGQFALAPKALVVISDPSVENAARALEDYKPTTLEACPNIFQRWEELADDRPELFRQVRLFAGTFDAVHPRTVRKFLAASGHKRVIWGQGWGQSEVGPVCIAWFTRRKVEKTDSPTAITNDLGRPVPILAKVKVVDPDTGRTQPRGKPGILMVASGGRCLTYLGEEDRHEMKLDGKWWNTGDVGVRGRFGKLRLVDREVDTIPGGSSIEVESVLLDRLDKAIDVTVLGVHGQLPVPVLSMRDGHLDEGDWLRATQGLPPLAEPVLVRWEDVPRTATWKVRRLELLEQVLGAKQTVGTGRWT
ncbi:AMP-binding protein [Streptomyces sp. 4.24]|uniref:AMP-binding protein n=1 Tax=Streptomyces tritrimontium TaxID=3406573 RepID=UPI003BB549C0